MTKLRQPTLGFTLLEVLVALAIFATTALVLMKIAMNNTQSIQLNTLRTKAHFVAMNVAAEVQIGNLWLTGVSTTQRDEQGEHWQITQTASATISDNVQKIEIQIAHSDPQSDGALQVQGVTTLSLYNYRVQQDS